MQRYRNLVGAWVMNPMQANIVGDISHIVGLMSAFGFNHQRAGLCGLLVWGFIDCLDQLASEDFHDAMSVGMVVDRGALVGIPHEKKLHPHC